MTNQEAENKLAELVIIVQAQQELIAELRVDLDATRDRLARSFGYKNHADLVTPASKRQ
jgi:hypothetical protein